MAPSWRPRPASAVLLAACALLAAGESPLCPSRQPCKAGGISEDEHFYEIREKSLKIIYREAQYFHFTCTEELQLEDAALPAFESEALVPVVKLTACAPPAAGYERSLQAFNVTAVRVLTLVAVPALPALAAHHLRGLPLLRALAVSGAVTLQPTQDFLQGHADLLDLRLDRVRLAPATLLELPANLESFFYTQIDESELPAAALARLLRLAYLVVRGGQLRVLPAAAAPALQNVTVTGPLDGLALGPTVQRVELHNAQNAALTGDCSGLLVVVVHNVTSALPTAWLARCAAVRELSLRGMPRGTMGATELAGAGALQRLSALRCELDSVAPRWLADVRELRELDVSYNRLRRLPSSLPLSLESVRATDNKMQRAAVDTLGALPALRELVLDRNPLADLCGNSDDLNPNDMSPLHAARALRTLSLQAVGLERVCRDWRTDLPRLATLDLRKNRISTLGRDDLVWRRDVAATVDLRENAANVWYSRADYRAVLLALPAPAGPKTTLRIDNNVQCNCSDYWFARALRERPEHLHVALRGLSCRSNSSAVLLRDVPLADLTCDVAQADGCPERCRCRVSGDAAELHCERAALSAVPRAPLLPPPRVLLLANNNISHVSLEDVPTSLEILDLRNNSLSLLEPALLAASGPKLLLAGNPLDCSCGALPTLRALAADARRVQDARKARCADGRRAMDAAARAVAFCARLPLWPVALAALALAAASAVGAAYLARPVVRHRIKRFLFERGLCLQWLLRPLPDTDDERPYDAFVSFSHHDQRYAYELARRLERGPAPRRLCLHERDWVPGEWIPAQITRSVRRSRRTLVLLSDHFLASTWALAELREAYGAALREERPRLLLLLLPALNQSKAAADPQLRAYLASVTYLRWEEPLFWEKLSLALPPRAQLPALPGPQSTPAPLPPPPPP